MSYSDFSGLSITKVDKTLIAVIDSPPFNMLTRELLADLDRFTEQASMDSDVLVIVLKSADPDFFITHAEFANLYELQPHKVPDSVEEVDLNDVQKLCERLRTMTKVTIAQVEGRVSGGGAAMVMACDMRYGARGKAVFNTMSVPVGCVPGGGASQYMPRLIGYARAAELILAGLDLDADTADRWGYINRAIEAEQIDQFVGNVTKRISSAPPEAIRLTKEVLTMSAGSIEDGLRQENFRFRQLLNSDASRANVRTFLELGGQTREGELQLESLLGRVIFSSEQAQLSRDPTK